MWMVQVIAASLPWPAANFATSRSPVNPHETG
jgi:hypothetical protein